MKLLCKHTDWHSKYLLYTDCRGSQGTVAQTMLYRRDKKRGNSCEAQVWVDRPGDVSSMLYVNFCHSKRQGFDAKHMFFSKP